MPIIRTLAKKLTALSGSLALATLLAISAATSPAMADETLWPKVKSTIAADQALEDKISVIMADMSLREKVGQLIMAEIKAISPKDARRNNIGGLLNGGGSWPTDEPGSRPVDWLAMANLYYKESAKSKSRIPIIWGTDAVHGHNNLAGATIFPHNIGLGAANNPALMRDIGTATAREVAVTGIDWVFAPTLAIVQDVRWGRTYEGYSSDPEIVANLSKEILLGLQGHPALDNFLTDEKVVATAKHFVGDGGPVYGSGRNKKIDQGDVPIDEKLLADLHGRPYIDALGVGVQTVMASFSSWNGHKMHHHKYLLTDILKNRMGFDGFVVGDWNGHEQVPGCSPSSCAAAINAGVDMIMVPYEWKKFLENTISQVKRGDISRVRLDDAVRRILRVKFRAGLMKGKAPSERFLAGRDALIGFAAHRQVARKAVRQSLTLLKNNGALPIAASRVLIAGAGADNVRMQSGGWTMDWQGRDVAAKKYQGYTSIGGGLRSALAANNVQVLDDKKNVQSGDTAIYVFGETPYAEFEGDKESTDYDKLSAKDVAFFEEMKAKGVKTVAVFLTGRPSGVDRLIDLADAFVVAWLPGSEGGGVADVLVAAKNGKAAYDFTGRLPFSWPANGGTADKPAATRFKRGFGLGY
jgi:beta-glucosidase